MGDDDGRPPRRGELQRLLDERLAFGVQTARRLVQDEDLGFLEEDAGDRDPLTLPAGEPDAALADPRVVAVRQPLDELARVRRRRCRLDRRAVRVRPPVRDVLPDRPGEERVVLRHDADPRSQLRDAAGPDIGPAHPQPSLGHVPEAGDE